MRALLVLCVLAATLVQCAAKPAADEDTKTRLRNLWERVKVLERHLEGSDEWLRHSRSANKPQDAGFRFAQSKAKDPGSSSSSSGSSESSADLPPVEDLADGTIVNLAASPYGSPYLRAPVGLRSYAVQYADASEGMVAPVLGSFRPLTNKYSDGGSYPLDMSKYDNWVPAQISGAAAPAAAGAAATPAAGQQSFLEAVARSQSEESSSSESGSSSTESESADRGKMGTLGYAEGFFPPPLLGHYRALTNTFSDGSHYPLDMSKYDYWKTTP